MNIKVAVCFYFERLQPWLKKNSSSMFEEDSGYQGGLWAVKKDFVNL